MIPDGMRINPDWHWYKFRTEKYIPKPKPSLVTKFMVDVFNDTQEMLNESAMSRRFFIDDSNPVNIKNPDRLFFQFWKSRFIPNPDYVEHEPFTMDIARGKSITEHEDDYREHLLDKIRCATHLEYAEQALMHADIWNRDPAVFIPIGVMIDLTESECIRLAENYRFSLDDIKRLFWRGRYD